MSKISYRSGYKYQLAMGYRVQVDIEPRGSISTRFIDLDGCGWLSIQPGYAWDGPSGPTIDTKSSMRGSLVHDALYQLIREGRLLQSDRDAADEEFYRLCVEDGMWKWRAWLWRREVRKFAGAAADPKNKKRVYSAP